MAELQALRSECELLRESLAVIAGLPNRHGERISAGLKDVAAIRAFALAVLKKELA